MTSGNQKMIDDIESIKTSLEHMVAIKRRIDKTSSYRSERASEKKSRGSKRPSSTAVVSYRY
jgi:hypothetical protein